MKRALSVVMCVVMVLVSLATCSSAAAAKKKKKKQETADPLYSLSLMREGVVLMQQSRFDIALTRFQEADRVAPGNATNNNMMGLCYLQQGDFDNALVEFNKALQLVPLFTDARNNRGATYLAMRQYHLAEVDFVAVLGDSTYPHAKQVNYNLGLTYLERGQLGSAEESFRRSIVPPNPVFDGYLQLASLAQRQGELELSVVLLEEAQLNYPEAIEVSLELGKVLILLGRDEEARPFLEQVIADDPNSDFATSARNLLDVS